MPRPRWRLALAVSALLALPSASGAESASPTVRVVRVKAVADEAFRAEKDWEKEIRGHVAWSDQRLRELAGIGLELVEVAPWTTHRGSDMTLLLNELEVGVEKDGAEAVIGFTGHPPPVAMALLPGGPVRYPVPFTAGIAFPFGDRAVIRRTEWERLTRHTLIHEIAHLFGALHVEEESLLETATDRMSFRLDPFNRRVIDLTRHRDFDRGIREVPPDELAALVDLYRQAPLGDQGDSDTAIRVAYLFLLGGEVEDAIREFRRAVEIAPEETRGIVRYAVIPELEAWAQRYQPTLQTRYVLGQAYFLAERWEEASTLLQPDCREPSEEARSCALLGAVYLASGQPDRAEEALRTALRRDDSLAEAHATLARLCAAAGRYDEALELFGRAQELAPGDVDTLFDAGLAYLAAGAPGAAEASFEEVLRLREIRDDARAKLAVAVARQGRGKEAREIVKPFERFQFLSAFVLRDMAEVYFLSGDTEAAFEKLQLAKRGGIDVQDLEARIEAGDGHPREVAVGDLIQQAEAYYRTGAYETSRGLLARAAKETPREPEVHYWLGRVARAEGDDEGARRQFQRSLELEPDFRPSQHELGRFAYDEGDYAQAVSWLESCVEGGRGDSSAYFMLGRSQFELGAWGEAEERLRSAIRKRSGDGNFFYFLARVLIEQGRHEEARRELELALDSRSLPEWRREDAHLRLARLLEATGQSDDAEDHVAVALGLAAPETPSVPAAAANATDRVEIVRVSPSLSRALERGREVRIVATVRYDLRSADRGTVFLAPQGEDGATLVRPQPRAAVERGQGEVTLVATITTPTAGKSVEIFLALHARGNRTSTAATRARYALE